VMTIPMMVVVEPSVASIPITRIITLSIMAGRNPTRVFVRRPSPIALVPPIVMSDRKPIAFHPNEIRRWPYGHDHDRARRRGSADLDSDRDLPMSGRGADCEQKHEQQEHRADESLHLISLRILLKHTSRSDSERLFLIKDQFGRKFTIDSSTLILIPFFNTLQKALPGYKKDCDARERHPSTVGSFQTSSREY
jgi:hypothetical protein